MTQMSCFFRCYVEQSETSLDVMLPPCYKNLFRDLHSVQNDKLTDFIREISVVRGS